MSVVKEQGKNTYMVRYYQYDKLTGKRKFTTKRGFRTKKEALAFDAEWKAHRKNTEDVAEMTIDSIVDDYFMYMDNLKDKSLYNKRKTVDLHILNKDNISGITSFRGKKLKDINATSLKLWQNAKSKETNPKTGKKYSDTYLRNMRKELSAILNYAEKIRGWDNNPSKVVPRMGKSDAEDIEFWDYDEYKKFENVIEKDSMDYIIFKLLYYTGVRIGELLALHRSDIIWDSNEISINKTVNKGNGVELYTSPKTVSSKRKVSVPSALMRELKEYVDRIYDSEEDVVLFPICDRTVAKHLKKYIDVAKVKEIHTHCLRHSHVALLISKGEDIYIISKRLGHKDIKTTMNTYGHLYPNADKDMAERLNELV